MQKETKEKKISAIHKANIQKLSDGEFLQSCRAVAVNYPEIKYEEMIIDNCCMQLVMKPQQFDIMLTPNLYGAITTNVSSALIGGPGFVTGVNYGENEAIFEAGARHVGLDKKGKNIANPVGMLLTSVEMLNHMGLITYADKIQKAVYQVLESGKVKTVDIGGKASTHDFTQAVIDIVAK